MRSTNVSEHRICFLWLEVSCFSIEMRFIGCFHVFKWMCWPNPGGFKVPDSIVLPLVSKPWRCLMTANKQSWKVMRMVYSQVHRTWYNMNIAFSANMLRMYIKLIGWKLLDLVMLRLGFDDGTCCIWLQIQVHCSDIPLLSLDMVLCFVACIPREQIQNSLSMNSGWLKSHNHEQDYMGSVHHCIVYMKYLQIWFCRQDVLKHAMSEMNHLSLWCGMSFYMFLFEMFESVVVNHLCPSRYTVTWPQTPVATLAGDRNMSRPMPQFQASAFFTYAMPAFRQPNRFQATSTSSTSWRLTHATSWNVPNSRCFKWCHDPTSRELRVLHHVCWCQNPKPCVHQAKWFCNSVKAISSTMWICAFMEPAPLQASVGTARCCCACPAMFLRG